MSCSPSSGDGLQSIWRKHNFSWTPCIFFVLYNTRKCETGSHFWETRWHFRETRSYFLESGSKFSGDQRWPFSSYHFLLTLFILFCPALSVHLTISLFCTESSPHLLNLAYRNLIKTCMTQPMPVAKDVLFDTDTVKQSAVRQAQV